MAPANAKCSSAVGPIATAGLRVSGYQGIRVLGFRVYDRGVDNDDDDGKILNQQQLQAQTGASLMETYLSIVWLHASRA